MWPQRPRAGMALGGKDGRDQRGISAQGSAAEEPPPAMHRQAQQRPGPPRPQKGEQPGGWPLGQMQPSPQAQGRPAITGHQKAQAALAA